MAKETAESLCVPEYFEDYREMIDKMDIIFPSIEEQQLIVNFLLNIENRLLYAEKILEKLESTKKGLLQQLFI